MSQRINYAWHSTMGGGLEKRDFHDILNASYDERPHDVGSWRVDPELSGKRAQVYTNDNGDVVVSHRGTKHFQDVITDAKMAFGIKSNRFVHAKKVADAARAKYPGRRIVQVGHSLGHALAQHAGGEGDEYISHNGAIMPWAQRRPKTTITRSKYDVVSAFAPNSAETIRHSGPLDILGNHRLDSLQKGDQKAWIGRR